MTPLDRAHLAAEDDGTDTARLTFFERLAEAELHLLLDDGDTRDGTITPRLFEIEGTRYALAFDLPDRLTDFAGAAATATLSGRRLATMLASENLGLGLNLEDAPSAQLLDPEALRWLNRTLAHQPEETEARIQEVSSPGDIPDALLTALDGKLGLAVGLARTGYLAGVAYEGGARGHILGFVDVVPGAEGDLARAVSEALVFSGLDAGQIDVTFLRAAHPLAAPLARHGLRIDLPVPDAPATPTAPGTDAPPRLR